MILLKKSCNIFKIYFKYREECILNIEKDVHFAVYIVKCIGLIDVAKLK